MWKARPEKTPRNTALETGTAREKRTYLPYSGKIIWFRLKGIPFFTCSNKFCYNHRKRTGVKHEKARNDRENMVKGLSSCLRWCVDRQCSQRCYYSFFRRKCCRWQCPAWLLPGCQVTRCYRDTCCRAFIYFGAAPLLANCLGIFQTLLGNLFGDRCCRIYLAWYTLAQSGERYAVGPFRNSRPCGYRYRRLYTCLANGCNS